MWMTTPLSALRRRACLIGVALLILLPACTSRQPAPAASVPWGASAVSSDRGNEVALFALGLIDTGYQFGGKNPEAGLDCSGMVAYVYGKALGLKVSGSAADIARRGRPVDPNALKPGDLVFFNTLNRPYSHVGIYIGDGRFVHAPSSNGRVRKDHLDSGWFSSRFDGARAYFD
jgi:cell wall-associated NlpC family hydrolase